MATEINKEYSMDYHLNTLSDTLNYLHSERQQEPSQKLDSMLQELTKVVRLIKGIKELK